MTKTEKDKIARSQFILWIYKISNLYDCANNVTQIDGTLNGVPLSVFISSDVSSKTFAAVWHIAAAWWSVMLFSKKTIRNYFRIESYPHKCPYVQVERKEEELIFLDDGSKMIARFREIEQRVIRRLG